VTVSFFLRNAAPQRLGLIDLVIRIELTGNPVFRQPSCFLPQPLRGCKNPIPRWIVRPSRSGLDVQNPQFHRSSTDMSDFDKTDEEGREEARLLNATCASKLLALQSLDRHPRCRREHPAKSSLQSPDSIKSQTKGANIPQSLDCGKFARTSPQLGVLTETPLMRWSAA
jgi:hypothetical protein